MRMCQMMMTIELIGSTNAKVFAIHHTRTRKHHSNMLQFGNSFMNRFVCLLQKKGRIEVYRLCGIYQAYLCLFLLSLMPVHLTVHAHYHHHSPISYSFSVFFFYNLRLIRTLLTIDQALCICLRICLHYILSEISRC